MEQRRQVPSCCQPVLTTYCLCSYSLYLTSFCSSLSDSLSSALSTIMHLGILKGSSTQGVPVVPQVSELAHMTVPCAPCVTISAASQDTQILSPLAVTHSDLYKNSLFIWKRLNFQLFEVHFITYCAADLACESTVLSPLLCGYRTIAQAVKWHRIWQSALAAFLMLSLSALHPWAKDTFYCYSTASTWGCLCRVEKNPSSAYRERLAWNCLIASGH